MRVGEGDLKNNEKKKKSSDVIHYIHKNIWWPLLKQFKKNKLFPNIPMAFLDGQLI